MSRAATLLAVALLTACGGAPRQEPAQETAHAAVAPGLAEAGYVGLEACRPCHAERWSTFSHTGMGRSWYSMAADRVIEDWSERNTVVRPQTGLTYRMFRRDGKFFMRQSVVDRAGRESAADERELTR